MAWKHSKTRGRPGVAAPGDGRAPMVGLARALSKLGFCSRSQAGVLIKSGKVRVNGQLRRDPEFRVQLETDRIVVDQKAVEAASKIYVMLNKPRAW